MLWQLLNGVVWIVIDIYHAPSAVRQFSCTPAENSSMKTRKKYSIVFMKYFLNIRSNLKRHNGLHTFI